MSEIPKIHITLPSGEVRKYSLQMESIRIGRAPDNTVVIEDSSMSAHHAVLHLRDSGYEIVDLGSTNGIEVGGLRVFSHRLTHGDEVKIGSAMLRFDCPSMVAPEAPVEMDEDALAACGEEEDGDEDDDGENARADRGQPVRARVRETSGGGCFAPMALFVLTLLSPVIGMHVRHYQETGRILAIEVIDHCRAVGPVTPPTPAP